MHFSIPIHLQPRTAQRLLQTAAVCGVLIVLAGCVAVPADTGHMTRADLSHVQLAADIKLAQEGWPEAQWWLAYGDPQLDALIRQALQGSPTLEAAAARIAAAQAALTSSQQSQQVVTGFNGAVNDQRYSANGLLPPPIGGSFYTDENLQLQARYDLDWWGKHKAQIAAAAGETNVRKAEYAQAERTLATAIARSYFNLQSGWARLANLQQMLSNQDELVADKNKRIARGLAAQDEQRKAETRRDELKLQIVQLTAQTTLEREALRALVAATADGLPELKPQPLPVSAHALPARLGFELLARRPDLQAARWRVQAALNRVDMAGAAFYPDVNLIGSFGLDAVDLGHLLETGSRTVFAGASLSVPLFNSKQLSGQLGIARSQRDELFADYNQTVFDAVRDVAQAGANLQGVEQQIRQQAEIVQTTSALQNSVQKKFRQGLTDHAAMLEATLAVQQKADVQLQLHNQQLLAEIFLVKALGGGYQAEPDPTPGKPEQH
jgi:multidrug efflux system outer membrane protein